MRFAATRDEIDVENDGLYAESDGFYAENDGTVADQARASPLTAPHSRRAPWSGR